MASSSLRVLEADPINADFDSDLDLDSPNAETALLQDYPESREEDAPLPGSSSPPRHRHYVWVIGLSLFAAFVIEVGDFMQRAPMMRAIEDILCRKYYESATPLGTHITLPIPEQDCKFPAVQGELAMLKGWDAAFSCIPGLLLALPFGYVSDTYGRKIVLVLSLLGITLSLAWSILIVYLDTAIDTRWLWAGNVFLCIGGGTAVIKATLFAMFTDVTPEDKRAAVFFQFIAATMLSPMVAVPASWYLMQRSTLLAIEVGMGFICAGLFLVLFLPETLERAKVSGPSAQGFDGDEFDDNEGPVQPSQVLSVFGVIKGSNFVLANPALRILIFTFISGPVLLISMSFLVQFTSHQYHWSIADASFITPFSAAATLVVLVVVLPLTYSLLGSRLGLRPAMRDLVVARVSLIFVVVGCLAIGLALKPALLVIGLGIISLGAGYLSSVRSLITSFVHVNEVSRLFGIIAVIEQLGSVLLGPLISKSFSWGMDLGGIWSGITFILAGIMVLILGIPVYIIRPPKPEDEVHG